MRMIAAFATSVALAAGAAAAATPAAASPQRAAASTYRTNAEGLAIIEESEGLRLKAYTDGQRWFIGYGHSATAKKGMVITKAKAEALLKQDLAAFEKAVAKAVTVPVTSNEFSAMASLCYTLGGQRFAKTDVVTLLNAGDRKGAADAFRSYVKATVNGVKKEIPHLVARREKERALFLKK